MIIHVWLVKAHVLKVKSRGKSECEVVSGKIWVENIPSYSEFRVGLLDYSSSLSAANFSLSSSQMPAMLPRMPNVSCGRKTFLDLFR